MAGLLVEDAYIVRETYDLPSETDSVKLKQVFDDFINHPNSMMFRARPSPPNTHLPHTANRPLKALLDTALRVSAAPIQTLCALCETDALCCGCAKFETVQRYRSIRRLQILWT
jgi:hypothetical protein